MSKPSSFLQRSVAYVLLISFLLESCWNPSIPPLPIQPDQPHALIRYTPHLPKKPILSTYEERSSQLAPWEEEEKEEELELHTSIRREATSISSDNIVD